MGQFFAIIGIIIVFIIIRDVFFQKKHTIQHNFPLIGHLRYFLEKIGPELRQYWVSNNREELPFNRSHRAWIYASSKKQNNYQGFGTDKDFRADGHIFIKHNLFPYKPTVNHPNFKELDLIPCTKTIGQKRKNPYKPKSIINVSAMSFGALSSKAVESLNQGAKLANCYHNTGEGGFSPYHQFGADVCFQIGTGYFGCRNIDGSFSMEKLVKLIKENSCIKIIECKLSQGAKPGHGGLLPAAKVSKQIAEVRGVPIGQDIISPPTHSAFHNIVEMCDWIEEVADKTGLPVGIKSAIGKTEMWELLAKHMKKTGKGPDYIQVDGGEGGTGAAPPSFADHVSLPFDEAFSKIYQIFQKNKLTDKIVFIGSGKLGLPANAIKAMAMGCDMISAGRESLISIGCIQAQICHTGRCPTGIATQSKWLQSGIDPTLKSVRFSNYIKTFRKEVLEITHACGYEHPCQFTMEDINMNDGDSIRSKTLKEIYGYEKDVVKFAGMKKLL